MVAISSEDIDQAESLLRAFINETFPNVETRKGSAFRTLVISPAAAIYALMLKENESLRTSLSISNISEELFDETVIESFLENFLVTRNEGSKSNGILRLDFSIQQDYFIPLSTIFIVDEEIEFQNLVATTVLSADLLQDSEAGTFYTLLDVESVLPTATKISQDTILTLGSDSFINTSLVAIRAYAAFSTGRDKETIEEFKARTAESITVRDLVTDKAIRTVIPENFSSVRAIHPVGYGDDEMLRDLVLPHNLHKGGDVDIFVRTDEIPAVISLEKIIIANLQIELVPPETPIHRIERVELKKDLTLFPLIEGTDYTIAYRSMDTTEQSFVLTDIPNYYSRFSPKEKIIITFTDTSFNGRSVLITLSKPSSIQAIQDFLELQDNRVICANLLARSFCPVFVSMNISYRSSLTSQPVDEDAVKLEVQEYINSLAGLDTVDVSKIVDIVRSSQNVEGVLLPVTVSSSIYKTDGTIDIIETSDKLVISTEPKIGFSQKICQYILNSDDITLTKVIDG